MSSSLKEAPCPLNPPSSKEAPCPLKTPTPLRVRFKESWICYIYESYTPFLQEYIANCLESKKFYLQQRYLQRQGTLIGFNIQRELKQSEEEDEEEEEEESYYEADDENTDEDP